MTKRLALLSCTSQRKNSSNEEATYMQLSPFHLGMQAIPQSTAQFEESEGNHQSRKKSSSFIRPFRTFCRRILNHFRRRTKTATPSSAIDSREIRRETEENIYETISWTNDENIDEIIPERIYEIISWEPLRYKHIGNLTDPYNFCPICKRRSPPQVTWKHSWTANETIDALSSSPFCFIPNEIYLQIFRYFSVGDLTNVSLVCRRFKMIVDDDMIWKSKCPTSKKLLSESFKEIYMDWIYEKYLRNHELEKIEDGTYYGTYRPVANLIDIYDSTVISFIYPKRLDNKNLISLVPRFKRHPNSFQQIAIELSVDLDKTILELISLLEKVSSFHGHWFQPTIIKQMIVRYYRFMKLKSLYPSNILLIPTLDIEIIWQTHLLRPEIYRTDCLRLFGRIIDHSLLMDDIEQFLKEQTFIDTCQLYEEHFGEQYCALPIDIDDRKRTPKYEKTGVDGEHHCLIPLYSYWDETYFEFAENLSDDYENPFSFTETDVIKDSQWFHFYKNFMFEMRWKISNGNNIHLLEESNKLDPSAILLLKKSYERFLYLAAKYPPSAGYDFIHPTYAIDLVCHSHMQEPLKYLSDCQKFVGYVIDHEALLSIKTNEREEMNDIWKSEFNCDVNIDHLYKIANEIDYSQSLMYF